MTQKLVLQVCHTLFFRLIFESLNATTRPSHPLHHCPIARDTLLIPSDNHISSDWIHLRVFYSVCNSLFLTRCLFFPLILSYISGFICLRRSTTTARVGDANGYQKIGVLFHFLWGCSFVVRVPLVFLSGLAFF
jgi:hypothetical protein